MGKSDLFLSHFEHWNELTQKCKVYLKLLIGKTYRFKRQLNFEKGVKMTH